MLNEKLKYVFFFFIKQIYIYIDPDIVYRGERVHVYINRRPVNYSKCDIKELVSLARKRFNCGMLIFETLVLNVY